MKFFEKFFEVISRFLRIRIDCKRLLSFREVYFLRLQTVYHRENTQNAAGAARVNATGLQHCKKYTTGKCIRLYLGTTLNSAMYLSVPPLDRFVNNSQPSLALSHQAVDVYLRTQRIVLARLIPKSPKVLSEFLLSHSYSSSVSAKSSLHSAMSFTSASDM